eukprot:CAMPEP_0114230730 /NCGR_PEP_ID=MMETSP0058-20121206/3633_1 /TAXON_ID=36894 /ORGANISM="Pyramimonas parkeae, CCMP726" /LENGTH=405 /DNA_ID=CAMNT_0001341965 /DNA_START=209 /DNA_END=1423 /DNA_ORIENTATION=+
MSRFPVPEHTPLGEPSAAQGVWTTTDPEHVRDQIGFTYAVIFQDDQLVPGFAVTVCRECNIAPKVEVESRDSAPTLPAASPSSIDPPEERTVFDSWVQLKVPLSSNTVFRRAFRDVDGSARVGRILELADGLAADVGYRHAVGGYKQGVGISVATASIYSLVLNGREFVDSEDIFLRAYVTRVGSSSMEVCIEMEQIATATRAHAFFVMVALDHKKNRPRKVPAILDVPARIAEQAAARHERRLQRGKGTSVDAGSSLSPAELKNLHNMWLRHRERFASNFPSGAVLPSPQHTMMRVSSDERRMSENRLESTLLIWPNEMNVHGTLFGGIVTRTAIEAAYMTVAQYLHSTAWAALLAVDDVFFLNPIPSGAMTKYIGQVIFTEGPDAVVRVECLLVPPRQHPAVW